MINNIWNLLSTTCKCCVANCFSGKAVYSGGESTALFCFPNYEDIRKRQVTFVNRKDWQPISSSYICKNHLEAKHRISHTCSVKKVFLEIPQNSQESTCARASILIKLQAICSKLTNKDTRTMPLALFWCLYC